MVMIRALRALTVARAEGIGFELYDRPFGFVLCDVMREGSQAVSADGFPHGSALNGGVLTRSSRCLSHDGDRRCVPIQVQQVLGQGARDFVGLSQCRTDAVRQSDDKRRGPAELLDLS